MGTTESNFSPAELQDVQLERDHSQKLAERSRCGHVSVNIEYFLTVMHGASFYIQRFEVNEF